MYLDSSPCHAFQGWISVAQICRQATPVNKVDTLEKFKAATWLPNWGAQVQARRDDAVVAFESTQPRYIFKEPAFPPAYPALHTGDLISISLKLVRTSSLAHCGPLDRQNELL
jgi:hypothetical protein